MRKEYNNRSEAKLVNPAVTSGEWEASRKVNLGLSDEDLCGQFDEMMAAVDAEQKAYFAKISERSGAR